MLGLLDHLIIKSILAGVRCEGGRHDLPEVLLILRPPELFAVATIDVTQGLSDKGVCALFAQLSLQGLHERNQDLSLDLDLLNDGNAHARPLILASFRNHSAAGGNTEELPLAGRLALP